MCGIAGVFNRKQYHKMDLSRMVNTMTDTIYHRGPDDYASYTNESISIGMRRLAIMDLTPGIYPFKNETGTISVIYNGEIYNYQALKKELAALGCNFKTNCDGEVILKGYEVWGTDVFSHLRGMFAISLWDDRKKSLILARDRIGIKPLYFYATENLFTFCSELKGIISLRNYKSDITGLDFSLDRGLVSLLLGFMYLPESTKTIVKGIQKVEPGTFMEITESNISIHKYWNLQKIEKFSNFTYEESVAYLDDQLTQVISSHLMSDVPLAVLLSGGLDSSLITAIMSKKLNADVQTYTAKFDHKSNESFLAKETADYLGTSHHEIPIDVSGINENIESYADLFDDLSTFDGGLITTKILSHEIKKNGVKVLLLGEGADEVFGGYSWYGISQLPFSIFPKFIKNSLYYYLISRSITYKPTFYQKYWNSKTLSPTDTFNDITLRELSLQLPNHLLLKVDKGTMSESIEARVPYLDHELVEFVYSLPQNFKLAGKVFDFSKPNEKRILRDVARKYLPEKVCSRKKRGFLLPMNDVIAANPSKVRDYIQRKDSIASDVVGETFINSLFSESGIGVINMQNEYFKWRLFLLEVWAQNNGLKV